MEEDAIGSFPKLDPPPEIETMNTVMQHDIFTNFQTSTGQLSSIFYF